MQTRPPHHSEPSEPRSVTNDRRTFLTLAATSVVGLPIVHAASAPRGWTPLPLPDQDPESLPEKNDLRILNERPVNAETPAHLLDDRITPSDRLFVRNNGYPPPRDDIDPKTWELTIGGESCENETTFTIGELRERFEVVTLQLTIECGGNGRSEFNPPATGNQWTTGAVGCPSFTGVRLRDVLKACGVRETAVYIGYHGADTHLSGDPAKEPISRGVPIAKAIEAESLIAFEMNGKPMPWLNGHPLRLVFGGWPASTSGKWLTRIDIRDRIHDGAKMTGKSYRVPKRPVAPGTKVKDEDMRIIESMPVKSLVTSPRSGLRAKVGEAFEVRGHAWAGDLKVDRMFVSTDFGQTWQRTELDGPSNRHAWQHWRTNITLAEPGYYEIWARAIDSEGRSQPMILPGWNPKGYLNNACHRVALQAEA